MDYNLLRDAVLTLFSGVNPYVRLTNFAGPHNYPPTAFLFLVFLQNRLVFDVLSAFAFLVSLYLLTNKKLFLSLTVYAIFHFLFFPLKFNYGMGQINNFILLFVVLAYYYNPFFLAYAIGIKLSPIIFLFYYFVMKDFRKICTVVCCLLLLIVASLILIQWDFQKIYFLEVFWRAFGSGGKEVYYNQSLQGFLSRAGAALLNLPLSIFILLVTWIRGQKLSSERVFSAVACLMLMLNPIAWQHHFVLAIIPLILLFNLNKLLVILSGVLLAWNFKQPEIIPNELLSHQFYGIFILWMLALFGKDSLRIIGIIGTIGIIGVYCRYLLCRGFICF
jgi:hypothetical protein